MEGKATDAHKRCDCGQRRRVAPQQDGGDVTPGWAGGWAARPLGSGLITLFEGEGTPFARGKKGFLPPQTPPSSPKPATWVQVIENERPRGIKINIYFTTNYKNTSVRTYCLIMSPDPRAFSV